MFFFHLTSGISCYSPGEPHKLSTLQMAFPLQHARQNDVSPLSLASSTGELSLNTRLPELLLPIADTPEHFYVENKAWLIYST